MAMFASLSDHHINWRNEMAPRLSAVVLIGSSALFCCHHAGQSGATEPTNEGGSSVETSVQPEATDLLGGRLKARLPAVKRVLPTNPANDPSLTPTYALYSTKIQGVDIYLGVVDTLARLEGDFPDAVRAEIQMISTETAETYAIAPVEGMEPPLVAVEAIPSRPVYLASDFEELPPRAWATRIFVSYPDSSVQMLEIDEILETDGDTYEPPERDEARIQRVVEIGREIARSLVPGTVAPRHSRQLTRSFAGFDMHFTVPEGYVMTGSADEGGEAYTMSRYRALGADFDRSFMVTTCYTCMEGFCQQPAGNESVVTWRLFGSERPWRRVSEDGSIRLDSCYELNPEEGLGLTFQAVARSEEGVEEVRAIVESSQLDSPDNTSP